MTTSTSDTAENLWTVVSSEITGIQLIWETVNGLSLRPEDDGLVRLQKHIRTVSNVIQTALMESLLTRIARLMDPSSSGKGGGKKENLSLNRLKEKIPSLDTDVSHIESVWESSDLKAFRDKYLSHNDLTRSLKTDHTITIPFLATDIQALEKLVTALRQMRVDYYKKSDATYGDKILDHQIKTELNRLGQWLIEGDLYSVSQIESQYE